MKNNKGFTLIELVIIMGLMIILSTVAYPELIDLKDTIDADECQKRIDIMYNTYQSEHRLDSGVTLANIVGNYFPGDADADEGAYFATRFYCKGITYAVKEENDTTTGKITQRIVCQQEDHPNCTSPKVPIN